MPTARTSSRHVSTLPMNSAWIVVTYSRISVSAVVAGHADHSERQRRPQHVGDHEPGEPAPLHVRADDDPQDDREHAAARS